MVGEILEMVLNVQKSYMYLNNIFSAEDIRKQLPQETEKFDKLTNSWRDITSHMATSGLALNATQQPRIFYNLIFII
jgi:dynein heavy chain